MSGDQFSVVWNSFPTNLSSGLYSLFTDEHLVDVTLTAEGQILRAHKLILSVCSSYFRELFKGNTCKHPIVILKDVNYRDLAAMLRFMYQGEVNIKQEDIASFLKLAETLQIKGLTKEKHMDEMQDDGTLNKLKKEIPDHEDRRELPESGQRSDDLSESALTTVNSALIHENNSFVKVTSNTKCFNHSETDSDTENMMRSINKIINDNYTNQNELPMIEEAEEEEELKDPLDYTSSEMREKSDNTEEPLNYRLSIKNPCQDFSVPNNQQQSSYSKDYQKETLGKCNRKKSSIPEDIKVRKSCRVLCTKLGVNSPQLSCSKDFNSETAANNAKGKRTVRGIPDSSLPLETTLRVVSELGPTLRVERGKVVRMYSCPWCLRHFTRKENLKLHVRYIHGPLESLTCKLCGNKYKNSNSLRVHSYLYHNARRNKHNKPPIVGGNN